MILTREQAIEEHRKMWRWIAEETEKLKRKVYKQEYLIKDGLTKLDVNNECFCCQYALQECINNVDTGIDCKYCPIDWKSELGSFMCEDKMSYDDHDGYYGKWLYTDKTNWERAAEYARQIAELPERSYDFASQ